MWEKPQHLRFSLIPSYQINTLRSKRFLEPKLHHIQLLCALLLAKPASASLLTSLALLTMIHFSICAPSLTGHQKFRPSHPSSWGFLLWKRACDKVTSFLWLSQAGHCLTNPGSHLLCTLPQHCQCYVLHPLEWVGLFLWPLWYLRE